MQLSRSIFHEDVKAYPYWSNFFSQFQVSHSVQKRTPILLNFFHRQTLRLPAFVMEQIRLNSRTTADETE